MDLNTLKEFIEIAKKSGVAELEYESQGTKLAVKLVGATVISHAPAMTIPSANPSAVQAVDSNKTKGLIEVTSPFVGTFYRSASPTSEAYAKVGDRVSAGKVMCIVEAMKIMNEIESDVSGEVVEVCVENETYVEFGQVLFRLKP